MLVPSSPARGTSCSSGGRRVWCTITRAADRAGNTVPWALGHWSGQDTAPRNTRSSPHAEPPDRDKINTAPVTATRLDSTRPASELLPQAVISADYLRHPGKGSDGQPTAREDPWRNASAAAAPGRRAEVQGRQCNGPSRSPGAPGRRATPVRARCMEKIGRSMCKWPGYMTRASPRAAVARQRCIMMEYVSFVSL